MNGRLLLGGKGDIQFYYLGSSEFVDAFAIHCDQEFAPVEPCRIIA
jgi:hypothetical protein